VNNGTIYLVVLIVLTVAFALGASLPESYFPFRPPGWLRPLMAILMLIAFAAVLAYLSSRYFPCHTACTP
jgi:hypothetical protein